MAKPRMLAAALLLGFLSASSNLEAQPRKGLDALVAGDYEQAIAVFKVAAQGGQEKDRFINFFYLGTAYQLNRQIPEAIAAFEESLKHRDAARGLTELAGLFYGNLGQAYLDPSWTLSKVKCCRYRHLQRLKKCSDTPTLRVGIRRPVLTGAPAAGRRRRLGRPSRRSAWPGSAQCSGAPRA